MLCDSFIEIVKKVVWRGGGRCEARRKRIRGGNQKRRENERWVGQWKWTSVDNLGWLSAVLSCWWQDTCFSQNSDMHCSMQKRKKFFSTSQEKKKSYIHMQVQCRFKALGFMIFDPNQLTYLKSVICFLLLAVGQMEFCYWDHPSL